MEAAPPIRFAELVRRSGAAARAAGLVVPAFRTPPRRAGVARTIRRLPGGPVVAVRLRSRPPADVVTDMVEGVIVANGLTGDAAARLRTTVVEAVGEAGGGGAGGPPPSVGGTRPPLGLAFPRPPAGG